MSKFGVSISIDYELAQKINQKAKKDETTISKVVSDFVIEGFKREKR